MKVFRVYWNQPVCLSVSLCFRVPMCPSVNPSVYKILVILYRECLQQFCFDCIETLHMHGSYTEVLKDAILKCQLLLVEELSPLRLRFLCIQSPLRLSVHPSIYLSVCVSVHLKPFFPNPWTKLDKTSYVNSVGYCTD